MGEKGRVRLYDSQARLGANFNKLKKNCKFGETKYILSFTHIKERSILPKNISFKNQTFCDNYDILIHFNNLKYTLYLKSTK